MIHESFIHESLFINPVIRKALPKKSPGESFDKRKSEIFKDSAFQTALFPLFPLFKLKSADGFGCRKAR